MGKSKLVLYNQSDIIKEANLIRHNNAFIKRDGSFYLAKGYTGCNPSHQLESTALAVARQEITYDIRTEYDEFYDDLVKRCKENGVNTSPKLYYLRSILVHYYGFTLFSRLEHIESFEKRDQFFFDQSLLPNPRYYGIEATKEQIETLTSLFELNDDGTMLYGFLGEGNREKTFKNILAHKNERSFWHR